MNQKARVPDAKPSFVLKEFLAQKDKSTNDAVATLRPEMYATAKHEDAETTLKKGTIGLVAHDDFKRLKAELAEKRDGRASPAGESSDSEARRKKLVKLEKKRKSKLSFAFDDADDTSEAATPASTNDNSAKPSRSGSVLDTDDDSTTKRKRIKLGKDPSVNTSFLPDREREEQERIETEIKRKEWQKRQEEIKAEEIEIQFAFFDGLSHIGSVPVKKGEPIYNFLERAKKSFQAIRDVSADKLMFAKDDIIIPHELTFYFFEAHQVNGKHGPLFDFYDPDAPTKPRNKNDVYTARLLANEPRLGKIVTRKYLENNKHIYPCSRWELYDPEKDVTSRFCLN